MSDDTRRILDLLAQGKITVDDAHRLIAAVAAPYTPPAAASAASQSSRVSQSSGVNGDAAPKPRYLKIAVHKPANDHRSDQDVNIRVPIAIMRGGMRLAAIIPGFAGEQMQARLREKGIDLDLSKLDPAAIEAMLKDLGEMNIDIDSGKAQVRITCE
jgi:SHOCT-like protein